VYGSVFDLSFTYAISHIFYPRRKSLAVWLKP